MRRAALAGFDLPGASGALFSTLDRLDDDDRAFLARVADDTCRYTLSLLAAGDRRVFLYTAHGYMGLVTPPSFTTLVGADGYPYPSLAAYSFFTRSIEGRMFAGKADHGANGCEYTFRRDGARYPVVKL